jgi:hypothetical protein
MAAVPRVSAKANAADRGMRNMVLAFMDVSLARKPVNAGRDAKVTGRE